MQTNRAIRPGNVLDVDRERFLRAQAAIIDEPEERAITQVFDFSQHRLDFLCIQGASHPFPFRFPFHPIQECLCYPSLLAEPAGETPQRSQTPIVRGRCEGFLACEKGLENVGGQGPDWLLACLRQLHRDRPTGIMGKA